MPWKHMSLLHVMMALALVASFPPTLVQDPCHPDLPGDPTSYRSPAGFSGPSNSTFHLLVGPPDCHRFGTYAVNMGDVQGDGTDDLVVAREDPPGKTSLWLQRYLHHLLPGRQDGLYGLDQLRLVDDTTEQPIPIGDVNGDGRDDMLSLVSAELHGEIPHQDYAVEVRYGTDTGLDQDPDTVIHVPSPEFSNRTSLGYRGGIGDVNGDGYDDVMLQHRGYWIEHDNGSWERSPWGMLVYLGSSDGLPSVPSLNLTIEDEDLWGGPYDEICHGDFDGDGSSDVAMENAYQAIHVHMGGGSGLSVDPDQVFRPLTTDRYARYTTMHVLDLNGDGYDDMALEMEGVHDYGGDPDWDHRYVIMYAGSPNGLERKATRDVTLPGYPYRDLGVRSSMEVMDVDGNGLDDLVQVHFRGNRGPEPDYHTYAFWCPFVTVDVHLNLGGAISVQPDIVRNLGWIEGTGCRAGAVADMDGDGRDELVVVTGGDGIVEDDVRRTLSGKLIILPGPALMRPPRVLSLEGGDVLYAGLERVLSVDANPNGLLGNASSVRVLLDPTGVNVTLEWSRVGGFSTVQDPPGLMELVSNGTDVREDPDTGALVLGFRAVPGWSWPHENRFDVRVEVETPHGITAVFIVKDAFRVENDLELAGDPEVEGDVQGHVEQGDWVRGGENVTFRGLSVVYEGSGTVAPPAGACSVAVSDTGGSRVVTPVGENGTVEVTARAPPVTLQRLVYTITLTRAPGLGQATGQRQFTVGVDADPVALGDLEPGGDAWLHSNDVVTSVTVDDAGASGVAGDTVAYRLSTGGSGAYGDWTREGLVLVEDGSAVRATVRLTVPDGDGNRIQWRATDAVSNDYTVSHEIPIRVDGTGPVFRDAYCETRPGSLWCLVGVVVVDEGGSGVEASSVQYRVSPGGPDAFRSWVPWSGAPSGDPRELPVSALVELEESQWNYVQWRAMDAAGNGYAESPRYRVPVDVTPVAFQESDPYAGVFFNSTGVEFTVRAWDPGEGSGVDLSSVEYMYALHDGDAGGQGASWSDWLPAGLEGSMDEGRLSVFLHLTEGPENRVQLRAWDVAGNGPAVSRIYWVAVDLTPPTVQMVSPSGKQASPEVLVEVSIWDALAGVDRDRVEYRRSVDGGDGMGEWTPVEVSGSRAACTGWLELVLERGDGNLVEFRALDLAGNAVSTGPLTIWVNRAPVAAVASPQDGDRVRAGGTTLLDAGNSTDPDGDGLDYRWYLGSRPIATGERVMVELPAGTHEVVLVVSDPDGLEARASVNVTVEESPYSAIGDPVVVILLLAIVVVAVATLAVHATRRARR